ncbi:MAG: type II toxin-antitoxin system RelE/ParE family toxin [Candidatus Binatia bacterium]
MGSSRKDLKAFPREVTRAVGYALWFAQQGGKHDDAKALRGFGDAGVLEVIENHETGTYRAVYTVRFADSVYVLHVFQKKSRKGRKTPTEEMATIRRRLKLAREDYQRRSQ